VGEDNKKAEEIQAIDRARLDIAWKWFDFHAKQRTTIFNFFLIITGIILNAYVLAIKECLNQIAIALSVFGILQAIVFFLFDIRNRQLTAHAENVIEMVERTHLFPDDYRSPEINSGEQIGLLIAEKRIAMREGMRRNILKWFLKMKVGIYLMHFSVMLIFVLGIIVAVTK
jgi:hypothetical protein